MQVELQYIIKNIAFDVEFKTSFFDEETEEEIKDFVKHFSKEIYIDKSYVNSNDNKYNDVFLTDDGWESLKHMILISSYGQKLSKKDQLMLTNVFTSITECYILHSLVSYFGFEYINITDHIELVPSAKSNFDVIVTKDLATEWKETTPKE